MVAKNKKTRKTNNKKNKHVFAGTGISKANNPYDAGKEAVEMAIKQSGKAPNFGLVFCSGSKYASNDRDARLLVKGAHEAFMNANPKCKWMGCTTAGEISNYGFSQGTCVAAAFFSDYINIGIGVGKKVEEKPENSAKSGIKEALNNLERNKEIDSYISYLASKKKSTEDLLRLRPYYVMMLSQGPLTKKGAMGKEDVVVRTISSIVGNDVPIVGGSAADDNKLYQSYEFANGKLYKDAVVMMVFASDIHIGVSLEHGYVPTSKSFIVTKVKDRLILELDGKPAVKAYCKATGINEKEFRKNPLRFSSEFTLGMPDGTGNFFSLVPGAVVGNAIHTGQTLKQNYMLALLKADRKKFLNAAKESVNNALNEVNSKIPAAVVMFDCSVRYMNLRDKVGKEIELVKNVIGKNTPLIGFYTYGEQGLRHFGGFSSHFNATASTFAFTNKLFTDA